MTVQWQNRDLPIGQGMDDNTAKTALPPGKLNKLINAHFVRDGGLTKRNGFSIARGTLPSATTGDLLSYSTQMGDRLLARSKAHLYDYSQQHGGFIDRGGMYATPTTAQIVKSGNTDFAVVDCYATPRNNFVCIVWNDGSAVNLEMIDQTTGTVLSTFNDILGGSTTSDIQVLGTENGTTTDFWVRCGRKVYHYQKTAASAAFLADVGNPYDYFSGQGGFIKARMCLNGPAASATGFIWVGFYTTTTVGVARIDLSGGVTYAVTRTVTTGIIGSSSALAVANITGTIGPAVPYFTIAYTGTNGHILTNNYKFSDGTDYNGNHDLETPPNAPKHIVVSDNGDGRAYIFWDNAGTYDTNSSWVRYAAHDYQGTVFTGPTIFMRSCSIASDGILAPDGKMYLGLTYYSKITGSVSPVIASTFSSISSGLQTLNSCAFIVDLNKQVCARVLRDNALIQPITASFSLGRNGLVMCLRALSLAESATIQTALSLGAAALVTYQYAAEKARGTNAFRDFVMTGGCPYLFDGTRPAEVGFHVYPEVPKALAPGADGSLSGVAQVTITTAYSVGDVVYGPLASDPNGNNTFARLYMCVSKGVTPGTFVGATWSVTYGKTVSGTATFQDLGVAPPRAFAGGIVLASNMTFIPSTGANGFIYVITAGLPHTTISGDEPTWPTTVGGTVTKNGLTWLCASTWSFLTPAAGASAAGYTYEFVYSWVDDQGQLHRSAASVPVAISLPVETTGLSRNAIVSVTTLRVTAKTNVRIEVYRTAANGTVCQQIGSLANDTSVDAIGFVDVTPDSTQAVGGLLYQGSLGSGEFANVPPPACTSICVYNGRLVANSLENPYVLYFSKLLVDGFGVAWADPIAVQFNGGYGSIQAVAPMDDKLVIFQDRAISYITGDGPDNTGNGVAFSQPQLVSTDVGCSVPDSVILTPLGLFFQSNKGLYLFGRNLNASFIGESVTNTLTANITAAVVDPYTHQIIFLSGNKLFLYDYTNDAWGYWTIKTVSNATVVSIANFGTSLTLADANGVVSSQNLSSYTDPGGTYAFRAEIAANRLDSAEMGFGRVRGCNIQFNSNAGGNGITVTVYYDYDSTDNGGTGTALTEIVLNARQDDIQARFARRRCKAVSIDINETTIGTDLILEGITFEVGVEGGTNRKATTRRAH